ncbi:MAG: hypothetical protein LUH11_03160 [Candidatus Gastranaerophilales bacterium]|nr:hypothetical protein [Candidatus Gastranaerophilales bacterium]
MVYKIGVQNQNINRINTLSFGKKNKDEDIKWVNDAHLLCEEKQKHPITTAMKIQTDKLAKAITKYPEKGFKGSKNANFYEFLTMGMVPYLIGSGTMIAVFNLASKFFDTPAAKNASKLGKKMGLGVILYGLGKTFSKKLIETPVNLKYGIDVNLPYDKKVNELPEEDNKDNLIAHEYHKAYESVDFPRWDLFYDNEFYGPDRNSYYAKVGKKMGIDDVDLEHADQKVKPKILDKVVKTKLFSTLSSYLWAATGVGIAMQEPWENLIVNPAKRMTNYKNYKKAATIAKEQGKNIAKYDNFVKDFGKKFIESSKKFVNNNKNKNASIAGRILLGSAIGMTLLGNFLTLFDFNNKGAKSHKSSSVIDESKEKVVC